MSEGLVRVSIAALAFVAVVLFYGAVYSVHQDLAGSALTGKLIIELGDRFDSYSIYSPPIHDIWFSLTARLSRLTGLGLDTAIVVQTMIVVLVAAELGFRIRRHLVGAGSLFYAVSLLALIVLPILFKNVFGLREHMVALGLWPYLVLRASGGAVAQISLPMRIGLGAWMGAALLFKVFYSVIVFLVEVVDALFHRRFMHLFRAENITAGIVVAGYLLIWLGSDPEQRDAIRAMSASISGNFAHPLVSLLKVANWAAVAVALLMLGRASSASVRSQMIGLAVVLGAVGSAWLQQRWYSHHIFPIVAGLVVWWWLIGSSLAKWGHLLLAACIAFVVYEQFAFTRIFQTRVTTLERVIAGRQISLDGQRVALLTQHPSPYNQVIASEGGMRWTPLMNIAYASAELQPFDRPENAAVKPPPLTFGHPGWRLLHDRMLQLWEDYPPDILIIDRTHRWPLRYIEVDWLHLLANDDRFNAFLDHYSRSFTYADNALAFELYVRAD